MAKEYDSNEKPKRRKAITAEARENQVIAAAIDLAEKQILEGTASSQVITHFLKLGSTTAMLEKDILKGQKKLIEAKTEALHTAKDVANLYEEAMKAFRSYNGQDVEDKDE